MYKNTGAGATPDGEFTNGDDQQGIPRSDLEQQWPNMIQREGQNFVLASGLLLDQNDESQFSQAAVLHAEDLAQLRAAPAPANGVLVIEVRSISALYWWDAASDDADDGDLTIEPSSSPATGRWKRIGGDPIRKPEAVDVFVVYGQSNAAGGGALDTSAAFQVPAGWGLMWDWATDQLADIKDPTGKAYANNNASAWPAFAYRWALLSGRKALIVNAAVGGSTVFNLSSSSGSARWTDMIAKTSDAINAATAAGYKVGTVGMLWAQGEADAQNLTDLVTYEGYFHQIESEFRTHVQTNHASVTYTGMWISLLGYFWDDTDASHHQHTMEIQKIQTTKTENIPQLRCVFDKAPFYTANNGMMQADDIHYSQSGYDLMGDEMAVNIWSDLEAGRPIVKREIIERILRHKYVQVLSHTQNAAGTERPVPALMKVMEYGLSETLIRFFNNYTDILNGRLVNSAGYGVRMAGSVKSPAIDNEDGTLLMTMNPDSVTIDKVDVAGGGTKTRIITVRKDGTIAMEQLPASGAGLTGGDLFYDPADSNRVKYVP